jgi:hypothetical protein
MRYFRYGSLFAMLIIQSCSAAVVATPTLEQPSTAVAATPTLGQPSAAVVATPTLKQPSAAVAATPTLEQPSPTPPTPTAETSADEDTVSGVVILAEAGLNLRTGPDTASEVIGILPQNELVKVTGASTDGDWWQVACPDGMDGNCWISADPKWSEPANPGNFSLAGLIYSQLDQQPERPLWRVGTDGTPTIFLEESQNLGALSPDGRQAINCCLPRGETNLSLIDLATGESLQLTNTPDRLNFNPQWWEGNPETIVFVSTMVDPSDQPRPGPGNLAAVKTDGTGFQVLDEQHLMHSFIPALAPDGQTIAYSIGGENAYDDGILTPWLYHAEDGLAPFKYAEYGLNDLPDLSFGSAAWSPDGKYLAWVVGGELTGDGEWKTGIAMFDLKGQSVEILNPYVPANCPYVWCREAPQWSPNSKWLTWEVSPASGLPSFWIMQPDGTDKRLIEHAGAPIWSPDGDLLVYTQATSFTTSVVMVMETGRWQPQRTGLPTQIGIVKWISE